MADTLPIQSLNNVIIVGTASATGLIILVILNIFLCACIIVLYKQRKREKRTFHPQEPSHVPTITSPIRVQFKEEETEGDYSEVNPRPPPTHQEALTQQSHNRISVQQSHSQHSIMRPQGPHLFQHGLQRMPSIENVYSSVGGSQEMLSMGNMRLAQVQVYREHVPTRRGVIFRERGLGMALSQREYTPEHSLSQSAEVGSITMI